MLTREKLIAVISSGDLHFRNGDGYALVITDGRIVGAPRAEALGVPDPYLWSAKGSSEEERKMAERAASELIGRKRFSISKDSVYKILYDAPSMFFGGRIIFAVVGAQVQLEISSISAWSPGGVMTQRVLVDSLLVFAPEKLYDEKSGGMIKDESARP